MNSKALTRKRQANWWGVCVCEASEGYEKTVLRKGHSDHQQTEKMLKFLKAMKM